MGEEDLPVEVHHKVYTENKERLNELLKIEYLKWAKENGLPESLLELGWEEYIND